MTCKPMDGFICKNGVCLDVDECQGENHCHHNAECINTIGSFTCTCERPFIGDGQTCDCVKGYIYKRQTCVDIDECVEKKVNCQKNAKCVNTEGSYTCVCETGFIKQGELNECLHAGYLVLSTYVNKTALVVGKKLTLDKLSRFSYDEGSSIHDSCSLMFRNNLYVFGGHQISRLYGHRLQREGRLQFEFTSGSCANVDDKHIFLCFYKTDRQKCRLAIEPTTSMKEIAQSNHVHGSNNMAASKSMSHRKFFENYIKEIYLQWPTPYWPINSQEISLFHL